MGLSGQPVPALAHANHGLALMGPVRDFTGLALARGNPAVPGVALTNPVRDKSGLANWVRSPSKYIQVILCCV